MCTESYAVTVPPAARVAQDVPWRGEVLALEPADSVTVTTVCDNTVDIFLTEEGQRAA